MAGVREPTPSRTAAEATADQKDADDLDHVTLDLGGPTASSSSTKPAALVAAAASSPPSKLEPFLLLAKNARGAAAARLVNEATAAPGVYAFGELLEVKGIAELEQSPEHATAYALLETFAYKTWRDYKENASKLPKLNPAQETKLKHLSLVSLASRSHILPYDLLLSALDVPSVRQLEDLVIEAIYSDIIDARLDQDRSLLEVDSCMGRDVRVTGRPSSSSSTVAAATGAGGEKGDVEMTTDEADDGASVEALARKLGKWSNGIASVLVQLDDYIASIRTSDSQKATASAHHEAQVSKLIEEITSKHAPAMAASLSAQSSRNAAGSGPATGHFPFVAGVGSMLGFNPGAASSSTSAAGGGGEGAMINGDAMDIDGQHVAGKSRSPPGPHRTRKRGRN